jgi:abequosyltransferase
MESGLDKYFPLLTIAIPTFNRSKILNDALCILIPQIEKYGNQIELIISDNASTDDTSYTVGMIINKFKSCNIKYNINKENLGFFGNFIKCKNMSSGKFIWLLSDDDHLKPGLVDTLMNLLNSNGRYSCYYLKNYPNNHLFKTYEISNTKLLNKENYNLGLISATIFYNDKSRDEELADKYLGNSFIGFIFLLNTFRINNKSIIIEGECFDTCKSHPQGYNYFDVFINQWSVIYDFINELKISRYISYSFQIKYLFTFLLPRYLLFKTNKIKNFGTCDSNSLETINIDLVRVYKGNVFFWILFYPIIKSPNSFLLFIINLVKKVKHIFQL